MGQNRIYEWLCKERACRVMTYYKIREISSLTETPNFIAARSVSKLYEYGFLERKRIKGLMYGYRIKAKYAKRHNSISGKGRDNNKT